MEIRRVFVDKIRLENGTAILSGPTRTYVAAVLRRAAGDRIDLMDGAGCLHRCVVASVGRKEVLLRVLETLAKPEERRPRVTLCVSPIKGPRMDWLIEKATELGVERILPTIFKRTVVRPDAKEGGKRERWRRIAIEASRQSGRFSVPEMLEPTPLRGILPFISDCKNRLALYEKETTNTPAEFFSSFGTGDLAVVVGPEGGIDDAEIAWLKENGFQACTLGDGILRSETVPLVILSIIFYEYGRKDSVERRA